MKRFFRFLMAAAVIFSAASCAKEDVSVAPVGQEVEVKLYKPIDKVKEFVGNLESFDSETITISQENQPSKTFNRSEIALVRLTIDF